jgi:hypothetical protein
MSAPEDKPWPEVWDEWNERHPCQAGRTCFGSGYVMGQASIRAALTAEREAHAETREERDAHLRMLQSEQRLHAETKAAAALALKFARHVHDKVEAALAEAQQETARLMSVLDEQAACIHSETNRSRAAESALLQMTRAWATASLDPTWDGDIAHMPAPVAALVREHAGKPVGACQDPECGQRAPLVETFNRRNSTERWLVCAWGCTPALRATRNGGTDTE